jgi:hypothetical protein
VHVGNNGRGKLFYPFIKAHSWGVLFGEIVRGF